MNQIVMVCLDGISWEYVRASNMPSLKDIERNGTSMTCRSMMPTVTNVNNASILTGRSPLEHGITGNYFFEESDQSEKYMDSPRFLKCPTLLEDASSKGFKTLLITVKDKLRRLLSKGATTSFSLEVPSSRIVRKIGKPPSIYSSEANLWLLDAAITLLETGSFQIVYVSTTDYVPHKFAPKSMEAIQQMEAVDEKLGQIAERALIGVVADHGMNSKSVKVDLVKSLTEFNITSRAIPIIKDEYVEHHQNLGGSVYLYVPRNVDRALRILRDIDGVERVFTRKEACKAYELPPDRIGDLFVVGDRSTVFGPVEKGLSEEVNVRSHGSLHEQEVPCVISRKVKMGDPPMSRDALKLLLQGTVS